MACLLPVVTLGAQEFSVNWFKIGGGGGTSTGGGFSISGVAGQHDAGMLAGGPFTVAGGFWSQIAPVPGPPLLSISLSPTNTIILSWPSSTNAWVLEQNSDLGTTNWITAPETPLDDVTNHSVVISPLGGNWFYRLKD